MDYKQFVKEHCFNITCIFEENYSSGEYLNTESISLPIAIKKIAKEVFEKNVYLESNVGVYQLLEFKSICFLLEIYFKNYHPMSLLVHLANYRNENSSLTNNKIIYLKTILKRKKVESLFFEIYRNELKETNKKMNHSWLSGII